MAGHADTTARIAARHITPSVQRILVRFDDVPIIAIDPAWTIVAANPMARALLADDVVGQNAARHQFIGPQWVERDAEDEERFERELVGDLYLQIARHPGDTALHAIVKELHARLRALRDAVGRPSRQRIGHVAQDFPSPDGGRHHRRLRRPGGRRQRPPRGPMDRDSRLT